MIPIRAMIVDDEPLARRSIAVLLARDPEVEVVGEGSGKDALEQIPELAPDLLFLDIQMPELTGFDLLDQLDPNAIPTVVFVTAYDQFAIRAFDREAVDYLLKPFDDARFEKALARAKEQVRHRATAPPAGKVFAALERIGGNRPARRILVTHQGSLVVLPVAEIDWIEAADYYVRIHLGTRSYLHRESMGELEARLDPEKFCRVHRSAIVHVDRIRELQPHFRGDWMAILRDGTQVRISRSRRDRLEQLLAR